MWTPIISTLTVLIIAVESNRFTDPVRFAGHPDDCCLPKLQMMEWGEPFPSNYVKAGTINNRTYGFAVTRYPRTVGFVSNHPNQKMYIVRNANEKYQSTKCEVWDGKSNNSTYIPFWYLIVEDVHCPLVFTSLPDGLNQWQERPGVEGFFMDNYRLYVPHIHNLWGYFVTLSGNSSRPGHPAFERFEDGWRYGTCNIDDLQKPEVTIADR